MEHLECIGVEQAGEVDKVEIPKWEYDYLKRIKNNWSTLLRTNARHRNKKKQKAIDGRNFFSVLKELWGYRGNIYKTKTSSDKHLGTFIRPLARIIGNRYRKQGVKVWYRGRGKRYDKKENSNGDIRVGDALFLAIYKK